MKILNSLWGYFAGKVVTLESGYVIYDTTLEEFYHYSDDSTASIIFDEPSGFYDRPLAIWNRQEIEIVLKLKGSAIDMDRTYIIPCRRYEHTRFGKIIKRDWECDYTRGIHAHGVGGIVFR